MTRRSSKALALVLSALAAAIAGGSRTESWRTVGAEEFRKARIDSLAVDPDGRVVLAPEHREITRWDDPAGWSLAASASGEVFAGTGDEGRIHRVDPSGRADLFADLKEVEVHALAVDADGRLLAGSSPEGKLYRIGRDRKPQVLFDPEDRYIWAVLPVRGGRTLLATGDKARVYAIEPSGKSSLVYENPDAHVRCLAPGPDGSTYLGTSGRGLVIKLDGSGKARVIVDTRRQEVVALAVDAKGTLYAAAVGEERPTSTAEGAPTTIVVTAETAPQETGPGEGSEGSSEHRGAVAPPPRPAAPAPLVAAPTAGARIYRIDPDGFARPIWETRTETVYALAAGGDAGVLVGTGPEGSIYRLDPEGRATWYGKSEGGPVSALVHAQGRLFILRASPASVRSMGPDLAESGTIESRVFDARAFSRWGNLRWDLEPERRGTTTFDVRSGNSEEPDAAWSDWVAPPSDSARPEGAPANAPPGRYVQWRARMKRGGAGGPALSEVELRYRQRNLAPAVENFQVLPPGVAFQVQPSGAPPGSEMLVLQNRHTEEMVRYLSGGQKQPHNVRRFYLAGARTVTWDGTDANGDDLAFDVECRGASETRWRPLAKTITDEFLTWDSRSLADGWYRVRIVASDGPDNPVEETLMGERVSDPFVVDNTPPRIEGAEASASGRRVSVRFRAVDTAGRINYAEYSVDSSGWLILTPDDGIEDSRSESYTFEVELPGEGADAIVVRVADEGGNWVSGQIYPRSPGTARPASQ